MNRIVAVILLLLVLGCKSPETVSGKFKNNKTFNETQTKQLLSFLDEFDDKIKAIEKVDSGDIGDVYASFFKRLKSQMSEPDINIGIKEKDQIKLVAHLSKELSKELWADGYRVNINDNGTVDTLFVIPSININGKLLQYMEEEVAPVSHAIAENIERVKIAGDITPSFSADILLNYEKYDIEDDRIRLIIAFHYTTHNRGYLNRKSYESSIG